MRFDSKGDREKGWEGEVVSFVEGRWDGGKGREEKEGRKGSIGQGILMRVDRASFEM